MRYVVGTQFQLKTQISMLFSYIKRNKFIGDVSAIKWGSLRANFNVISIYKKEINLLGMYALSNEALQGHLEALYEPQMMSVGYSQGGLKKVS